MKRYKTTVIVSDTQYPYCDEVAEAVCMDFIKQTKPDQVIQIGDFADGYFASSYLKKEEPQARPSTSSEVMLVREKAKEWKALAPRADWFLIEGNHEERIRRYLEKNAPELRELPEFRPGYFFGFEQAGWKYIEPYGAGMWVGMPGGLWATHGNLARKWSGLSAKGHVLEQYGHSVIHGHTHRLGSFYHTNRAVDGSLNVVAGFEVGCLCSVGNTPGYTGPRDWQHGFAVVHHSTTSPRFHCSLVPIVDGEAMFGGVWYGGGK